MSSPADTSDVLTPVEQFGAVWAKRDDLFQFGGICGGKVRACMALSRGAKGLVAASSRASPQGMIVSRVAAMLDIPSRIHTAAGQETPELTYTAEQAGAEIIRHRPGYSTYLATMASRDASALSGWNEIPFGMMGRRALPPTRRQVENVPPEVKRIVMATGCGMSPAGVLWGLADRGLSIPLLLIRVGADPQKGLKRFAPPFWQERVRVVDVRRTYSYETRLDREFNGIQLDPIYEAKAVSYVDPGDLFWIVGVRPKCGEATK